MYEYDLYKAIEKISARAGLYVADQTLANIGSYISGYGNAMDDANIKEITRPKFEYFRSWLKTRFGFRSDEPGWVNMVLALAIGYDPKKDLPWDKMKSPTEEEHLKSIKLFFDLVNEYRNDKSTQA